MTSFSQLFAILKARWISAVLVLLVTVGLALGISLMLPKQYTAKSSVIVDVKSPDPIVGMLSGMLSPGYMATQVDVIMSDRVARRVVQTLHLTENTELQESWQIQTNGKGSFENWIAEFLEAKLLVTPSRTSNVINVSYISPNPSFAAALANAFVQAYIDISLELRVEPAKRSSTFFDARATEVRSAMEKAQTRLSAYQKDNNILGTDERLDVETQRLNELNSQLVSMQAISAESTSRTAQVRTSADQLLDVINNPVVAGLRADISRQEARLQELNDRLGEAHPQVSELKASIAGLRQRIDAETQRVGSSVNINNTINKSRETDVRAALAAQRTLVLKMKEHRDQLAILMRDVENAQRTYEQVTQRQSQTNLESQVNQTNISVLTTATEPTKHSSPNLTLNALLSVFLGGLLGVVTALLRERFDPHVRTLEDLSEVISTPIIGVLPKPTSGYLGRTKEQFDIPSHTIGQLTNLGR